MTTIFEKIEADKPHTHVFIIGVGEYSYLLGGKDRILDDPMGLKQLTSPPISATKLADWILKDLNNPDAPLGSVELLLSPTANYVRPKDGQQFEVKAATMGNIKTSFDEWYRRCNSHKDNVAIFYFCGHGLEQIVEHPLLLAEDFGESQLRFWENAIDFQSTFLAMGSCQAKVQCYFIDACRQTPPQIREIQKISATALVHQSSLCQKEREVLKLFATDTNQSAYGLHNQVTLFTDALINCLNGLGSEKRKKQWSVTTGQLPLNVKKILAKNNEKPKTPKQNPVSSGSGNAILHVCNTPPSVPVTISLNPMEASSFAELSLLKETVKYKPQLDSKSKKWEANILPDSYICHTYFSQRKYRAQYDDIWVFPPYIEEEIEVIKVQESVVV